MSGSSFGSGEGPGLVPCYSKRVLWWGLLFLPVSQHRSRVPDPEPSPLLVPFPRLRFEAVSVPNSVICIQFQNSVICIPSWSSAPAGALTPVQQGEPTTRWQSSKTHLEFRDALVSSENAIPREMEKKLGYLTLGTTQAPVSAQKRTRSVGRDAPVNALPDLHPYL